MTDSKTTVKVNLPESLLLLAIDDETGKLSSQMQAADLGTAAAVLLELLITGRIDTVDGKIRVIDDNPTGNIIFDQALSAIRDSKKPHDAKHWVRNISKARVKDQVLDQLIARNIVRKEAHRMLWIFPIDRFPVKNPAPENDLRETLRKVVIDGYDPDVRSAALIGLLKATNLTGTVFNKDERKAYKKRIDDIARGEQMSEAVSKILQETQAALIAVIVATTGGLVACQPGASAPGTLRPFPPSSPRPSHISDWTLLRASASLSTIRDHTVRGGDGRDARVATSENFCARDAT
jgi:Golgi phosphoprotein 3